MVWLEDGVPLRLALHTKEEGERTRFPAEGWIEATASDLASDLWAFGIREYRVQELSERVASILKQAGNRLAKTGPATLQEGIAEKMDQQGVLQGLRTAAVMRLNAMIMHDAISRALAPLLSSFGSTLGPEGSPDPDRTLNA